MLKSYTPTIEECGYYNNHGDRGQRGNSNRASRDSYRGNIGSIYRRNDNNRNVRVTQSENSQPPLSEQE